MARDFETRIVDQNDKYILVSRYSESGLLLADIANLEIEFTADFVSGEPPVNNRQCVLLRKRGV